MAITSLGPASYWTQANALLRKNLTFQKRNIRTNIRLISFPVFLCLLLVLIDSLINNELDKPEYKCGCVCADTSADGKCTRSVCGIEHSTVKQVGSCAITNPLAWAPLLQISAPEYRAVNTIHLRPNDLPNESCKRSGSCPGTILLTGNNSTFGGRLGANMLSNIFTLNASDVMGSVASNVVGSSTKPQTYNLLEPGFASRRPLYYIQSRCASNSTFSVPISTGSINIQKVYTRRLLCLKLESICVQGLHLWRNSSSEVNDEIYKGFWKGNSEGNINEFIAAYDFFNSNRSNFNVNIWYNSTYNNYRGFTEIALVRVPRSVNLASNAYLQYLKGAGSKILFDFVKDMPKTATQLRLDLSSLVGALFFTWVILSLFPVVLTSLIYEKQQNLRIMMKMHGLGDGPYWIISYAYFLFVSVTYMLCFVIFGSAIGLNFFTLNDYTLQSVFYFVYINLQISLAFLVAALFSNVKTATVVAYMCVFGTGLLGAFLFRFFIQDTSFPRTLIFVMQLYPGFSLYRGLYEFAQYALAGSLMGTDGMRWGNLRDGENGMKDVLIIMVVEWIVILLFAYYIDQVVSSGRSPLFFMQNFHKKKLSSISRKPSLRRLGSKVTHRMEKTDVIQERERVEHLLLESNSSHAIVCDNMKKVYPGKDGNPEKIAVKGLSLALPRGECFGMLGPNGAGKTSFISMMIGLTKPSSGMALVQGLDIRTDMDKIYTSMGVCPQHDLLWETLTGREHLLFYGRLKNLKGAALTQAVEESLKSVNLFYGGVGDKRAGKYSGGMKRRLSVAISLIGDPKVVYMDEPSTGLDPASRNNLWNVVKRAKQDRAIILTTHSMEEAEVLCDRLGIFVDGSLQCIGNAKELKARYGGSYVLAMTTSADHEMEVEELVQSLSPNATRVYQISGTQKFELPKHEVRITDVFQAVENAKSRFTVYAWGLADTTLEDVFIKVASSSQSFNVLS